MPRLFIAIELPLDVRKQLASVGNELGKEIKKVRWVPEENIHLTLKFLGSCPDDLVSQIEDRLKEATEKIQSFSFRLGSLGGFPSLKRVRVLWVGVNEGDEQVIEVQKIVEKSLSSLRFKSEKRKFHPHLTLARLKNPQDLAELVSQTDSDKFMGSEIMVEELTLFESRLKPSGALHTPFAHMQLSSVDTNTRSC